MIKQTKRNHLRNPSSTECFLYVAMVGALGVAILGAIYNEQVVWTAGLALFALIVLQQALVCYVNTKCERVSPDSV